MKTKRKPPAFTLPTLPPVKPNYKGRRRFNRRAWEIERASELNRIFAVDSAFIMRERPKELTRILLKAVRECARHSHVAEMFPDFDASSPTAIYYIVYCSTTMPDKCKGDKHHACDRWRTLFSITIARHVFHACVLGKPVEEVQRTFDAYREMYGLQVVKNGRRGLHGPNFGCTQPTVPAQDDDERQSEIARLRAQLEDLDHTPENEACRFHLVKEIGQLESERDEWPELIDDGEGDDDE